MTASKKTDNVVSSLIDNRIENDKFQPLDEFTFESAKKLCRRFDIGLSTLLKIVREEKVTRYVIGRSNVRYRVMDIIRLIDPNRSNQQRS